MEVLILLGLATISVIGYVAGVLYRNTHLKQTRASTLRKPKYTLQDKLTPAEFCLLMKGRVNKHALAGEIIDLQTQGYLTITRDFKEQLVAQKTEKPWSKMEPLQREMLSSMFPHYAYNTYEFNGTKGLVKELEYQTRKSLVQKGWIYSAKPHLTIESTMPRRYYVRLGIALVVLPILALLFGIMFDQPREDVYIQTLLTATLVLLMSVIIALYIHFIDYFRRGALHTLHVTKKYQADYESVYGVYLYMTVSGMDTMTPDYQALNFTQLDRLYPYAVAVGLDPVISRILTANTHLHKV